MSNVFANGLEISGKAVSAKTIAAFPDVCFTPPENPATPPGVPIPYPSFGMASDSEKGTGTVVIGGKTVNIKNKSDLSKTSGTEAGSAAKKGVVTSKNTGKEYFHKWSNDVKFEGEPVIRNTDLASNNHASPVGNTPPWVHIASMATKGGACETVYSELNGHRHHDNKDGAVCDYGKTGRQSEHTARASMFMKHRNGGKACGQWSDYKVGDAPCICMNTKRVTNPKKQASQKGMPHPRKSAAIAGILGQHKQAGTVPTTGEMVKESAKATVENHSRTKKPKKSKEEQEQIMECLELINLTYLAGVTDGDDEKTAKKKVEDVKSKPICAMAVNGASKSKPCPINCGA
ncbi:DUF4150 domain-containing protein [Rhodobacteraceae bacterium]|nr:DUF4150 domain-containing protein [Paracoccaceae bacterium]